MTPRARSAVNSVTAILLVLLPVAAVYIVFLNVARGGLVTDFEQAFYPAAEAVLNGENPYPALDDPVIAAGKAYVYPPLTAIVSIPLVALSVDVAGFVVMALLVLTVLATLAVLRVRDWRCYAIVLIWPPVLSAIQTGNITILLGFGAALAWRFRDSSVKSGVALGVSLAAKVVLWPLLVWLGTTRRFRAVAYALVTGSLLVVLSWAVIGFVGMRSHLQLLRRLRELEEPHGYTVYALAGDLGAAPSVARALSLLLAAALLVGVFVLARRGDDRRAFIVAIAAAFACSPIVWLHYFAMLLVAVAVAEPRLGAAWFIPLAMYASTGTYNGTTLQTAATIAAAVLTIVVALRVTPALPRMQLERPSPVQVGRSS